MRSLVARLGLRNASFLGLSIGLAIAVSLVAGETGETGVSPDLLTSALVQGLARDNS